MGVAVLTDQAVWLEALELTGRLNAIGLEYAAELDDDTAFGDDTRSNIPGLKTVTAQHEGFFDADPYDDRLFNQFAVTDVPMTVAAATAEASRAYLFKCATGQYVPQGRIGELFRFSVAAQARGDPLVRGTLMHNATRTSTANGTAQQLGAVGAAQKLYAALHVTAASAGDTLDVTIESDDDSGFASPTTRVTFTQVGAVVAAEYATPVAGAITDDWWRVTWTIAGAAPSYDFAVAVGIQ